MSEAPSIAYVSVAGANRIAAVRLARLDGIPEVAWTLPVEGSPGALAVSSDRLRLYAALRSSRAVAWFDIDPGSGALAPQGTLDVGLNPVHLSLSPNGSLLYFCSYGEDRLGYAALSHGRPSTRVRHIPSGHRPHCVACPPGGALVYVPCLGDDRIRSYRWVDGDLRPGDADVTLPKGSGPRHLRFHPDGAWACCVGESGSRLDLLSVASDGRLAHVDGTSTLPRWSRRRKNRAAEVRFDRRGRIYVSNRGRDSIAVFQGFDVAAGAGPSLRRVAHVRTEAGPRSFDLDPGGRFAVVAGTRSGRVAVHCLDDLAPVAAVDVGPKPSWVTVVEGPGADRRKTGSDEPPG